MDTFSEQEVKEKLASLQKELDNTTALYEQERNDRKLLQKQLHSYMLGGKFNAEDQST